MIEKYIETLTPESINNFAKTKNIILNENELNFTYNFIKKNYKDFFKNPNLFNIDYYKKFYTENNFYKIKKIFLEYYQKFIIYLK